MASFNENEGVWRTIKGNHIFIRTGQSLRDAMKHRWNVKNGGKKKLNKEDEDAEYELYKKAYETPDLIDPMTENSTDWAALSDKYSKRYEEEKKIKAYQKKLDNIDIGQGQEIGNKDIKKILSKDARFYKNKPQKEDKYYFGKEQYEKHGDTLYNNYYGKDISKRIADKDNPNGLSTIAREIGAKDEYEVVEALEGMARNGKAREIDDSTYRITDTIKDNPVRNGLVNEKEYIKKNNMEPKESTNKGYENEKDQLQRLKNVYYMDRVLRGMNNEDAFDGSWLMNGVADEDTDVGLEKFIENEKGWGSGYGYYTEDDTYNDLVKMYKNRVNQYAKDGVFTREWFDARRKNGETNWKRNAGLDKDEIEFLKKDIPNLELKDNILYPAKGTNNSTKNKTTYSKADNNLVYENGMGFTKEEYKAYKEANSQPKEIPQGKSNRKVVSDKIRQHILDYYEKPEDFVEQMDAMNGVTKWHSGQDMAKGGSYLIYTEDMRDFLDDLHINPKNKKFNDDKVFNTYSNLIGRESEKLYNELTDVKRKLMSESKLIQSYINRGYSKETAKKMARMQIKLRKNK